MNKCALIKKLRRLQNAKVSVEPLSTQSCRRIEVLDGACSRLFWTMILQYIILCVTGLTLHIVRVVLRVIFTSTRYTVYLLLYRSV